MEFITARPEHLEDMWRITLDAKAQLKGLGLDQWQKGYPSREVWQQDFVNETGLLAVENGQILAACAYLTTHDPSYTTIDGAWLTGDIRAYGSLHRVCVADEAKGQGVVGKLFAHAFAVKRHYYDNESLYIHRPQKGVSLAQNFLYSVRHNNQYTEDEAKLLDLCMVLHAEHGGGNNSAFTCRVLSSSGTDIYSSISAAIGSLKGPRHGGANKKVMEMFHAIEDGVKDWKDDDEVSFFLGQLLDGKAGDGSGLIYGMGHAIYTLSDPRARILKTFAKKVAAQKGTDMLAELELAESVERLTPKAMAEHGQHKVVCANVDLYSGMVYKMMDIPAELYTPLFAMSRTAGWCAHRLEEVFNPGNKIIRPAYKAVAPSTPFIPLAQRG